MKYIINKDCIELLDSNLLTKLDTLKNFEKELFNVLEKHLNKFDKIFNIEYNIVKYNENFIAATYINYIRIFIKKLIDLNTNLNSKVTSIILNELEFDILFNFSNLLDQQRTLYNNQVIKYIKKEHD